MAALLAGICVGTPARAEDPAAEAFQRAETLDQALLLAEAADAYERAEALAPLGAHAAAAHARATYLRAHAEGGFQPLMALERLRRDPSGARDTAKLVELGDGSRSFPPGSVRVESWLFLAVAWERLHDDERSLAFARLALEEPGVDEVERTEAARLVAETCLRRGDTTCAARAAGTRGISAEVRARITRLVRRRTLFLAATATLALTLLGAATVLLRARARVRAPQRRNIVLSLLASGVIGAFGLVAQAYEGASPRPFVLLGLSVLALSLLGRMLADVMPRGAGLRAAWFTLAIVAAAFLSLYASDADYLSDFRL